MGGLLAEGRAKDCLGVGYEGAIKVDRQADRDRNGAGGDRRARWGREKEGDGEEQREREGERETGMGRGRERGRGGGEGESLMREGTQKEIWVAGAPFMRSKHWRTWQQLV